MVGTLATHPAAEQLAAFRLGRLSLEELAEVERHLAGCDSCCETLHNLPDDSLMSLVRQAGVGAALVSDITAAEGTDQPRCVSGDLTSPGATTEPVLPLELVDHPKYRVCKLLGVGGTGAVFTAEHRIMGQPVASKGINSELPGK